MQGAGKFNEWNLYIRKFAWGYYKLYYKDVIGPDEQSAIKGAENYLKPLFKSYLLNRQHWYAKAPEARINWDSTESYCKDFGIQDMWNSRYKIWDVIFTARDDLEYRESMDYREEDRRIKNKTMEQLFDK